MKESPYKSYDELPLFLNAEIVAKVTACEPLCAIPLLSAGTNTPKRSVPKLGRLARTKRKAG